MSIKSKKSAKSRSQPDFLICKGCEFEKKQQLRCLFCGGPQCNRCGDTAYLQLDSPAIDKLHSTWITDHVIAMQRPTDNILIGGKALDNFVKNNITAVFNLTEPGEHPSCGVGVIPATGFSYTPDLLMSRGIKHFNFSWPDMSVPTLLLMKDIVNVAVSEINQGGKIAVHCHAGYGRTGLTIACVLIAKDRFNGSQVIKFIRSRRPGSIQSAAQEQFILRFEKFYSFILNVFPTDKTIKKIMKEHLKSTTNQSYASANKTFLKTIKQSVADQQYTLLKNEKERIFRDEEATFMILPKIIQYTTKALRKMVETDMTVVCYAIAGLHKLKPIKIPPESSKDPRTTPKNGEKLNSVSFTLTSTTLMELAEEQMLNDLKTEINENNYNRLLSITEVVSNTINGVAGPSFNLFKDQNSTSDSSLNELPRIHGSSIKHVDLGVPKVVEHSKFMSLISPRTAEMMRPISRSVSHSPPPERVISGITVDPRSEFNHDQFAKGRSNTAQTTQLYASGGSPQTQQISGNILRSPLIGEEVEVESDQAKSKRVAATLTAQLLLDWLETRLEPLFKAGFVDELKQLWKRFCPDFGDAYFGYQSEDKSQDTTSSDFLSPRGERSGIRKRLWEPLYPQVQQLLKENLDRYSLAVLFSIVGLFREIRITADKATPAIDKAPLNINNRSYMKSPEIMSVLSFNENDDLSPRNNSKNNTSRGCSSNVSLLSPTSGVSPLPSLSGRTKVTPSCNPTTQSVEFSPVVTMVGVRLGSALMQAHLQCNRLLNHRSLSTDIMKIFLLKQSTKEKIIINNEEFGEKQYKIICNSSINMSLLERIEAIIRTLDLLVESNWDYSNFYDSSVVEKVHWCGGNSEITKIMNYEKKGSKNLHVRLKPMDTGDIFDDDDEIKSFAAHSSSEKWDLMSIKTTNNSRTSSKYKIG